MIEKIFGFEIYGIIDSMRDITGEGDGVAIFVCDRTLSIIFFTRSPRCCKNRTVFGPAIPVEKRVAIGIWRLATGNSYRTVAKTFAVGKSTAVAITHEFCRALVKINPFLPRQWK